MAQVGGDFVESTGQQFIVMSDLEHVFLFSNEFYGVDAQWTEESKRRHKLQYSSGTKGSLILLLREAGQAMNEAVSIRQR